MVHCKFSGLRYPLQAAHQADYVLVEGNMLTEMAAVMEMVDRVAFLTIDMVMCSALSIVLE